MTRIALILSTALLAAACSDAGETATVTSGERSSFELPNDHALGSADAPVTVVEYASVSCVACANWSNTVYPDFKERYIDTGEVRYVLREFPAGDPRLFQAGSMLANCADDKRPGAFFDSVKLQFERFDDIMNTARTAPQSVRDQYVYIAKQTGLSEDEMEACLADETVRADLETRIQAGSDAGVNATPTFFVNGTKVKAFKIEDFETAIAAAKAPEG